MTFRARLMLLLTSFLLLTFVVVFLLDRWANERSDEAIKAQNRQIKAAVTSGYGDIARANNIAIQSLASEKFLYEEISRSELPPTVENILITDREGHVKDGTAPDMVGQFVALPDEEKPQDRPEDPVAHKY